MCRHLEKSLDFCGTTRETACGTKAESSATPAAQPRVVGERPSVSWLVEAPGGHFDSARPNKTPPPSRGLVNQICG